MRDLSLGNALVEGFVRNVTVEGKVASLEKLLDYKLNASDGFVSVPVYQVWANEKAYGNGFFILTDVKVKETMRDLRGDATRAYVDVSFMEVPAYQVNTGRDLASKPAAAAKALALRDPKQTRAEQQAATQQAAAKQADTGVSPKAGPGAPKTTSSTSTSPTKPQNAADPTQRRALRPTPP
jgi:predicted carbohydrate-binding protein with CBM5 and CBM33 domain